MFHVPENNRLRDHDLLGSDSSYGNNGCFVIDHYKILFYSFNVQVSDGDGWEHVSVSLTSTKRNVDRCPTWEEMCFIKSIFWDETDCVIQLHPPESEYISMHDYCLHLWRPVGVEIARPPSIMVGINQKANS